MVERIINLIEQKGFSINAVEKQLGFGNGSIKRFAVSSPSIDKIIILSKFLNVSVEYILFGVENPSNKLLLSKDEKQLLKNYKLLSQVDKARVSERVEMLVELSKEKEYKNIRRKSITQIRHNSYAVSAGIGFFLDDNDSWDMISVPDTPEVRSADYALTVSGDSMQPLYFDDDIILIKEQPCVEIGEIGIFVVNDEGYVKKFGGDRLISLNENYDDILFTEEDSIKCCGKVIGKV